MPDPAATVQAPLEPPPNLLDQRRRRGMLFLCLAVACVGFTLMLQMSLNANFLAGDLHIPGEQNGQIEAARESCGIIALLVLAILSGLAEPLVGAVMLVLLAVGLGSYSYVPANYIWILGLSMVWSQGLHVWMPLPNSMALGLAEPGRAGYRLGQLGSANAIGSFVALALALGLSFMNVQIRPMYILAGVVALLGAAACLRIPRSIKTQGPRLVFRKKYGLYYLLCLLEGWRKQIFLAFAGFLLVQFYNTPVTTMLILWGITQVACYFGSPVVGRLIDRIGERPVLLFYYISMIFIFAGYTLLPLWLGQSPLLRYLLFTLFVLDGSFFVLNMALTTYVSRLAPQSEHTATLSMGVAMNHVMAVTMPLVGGMLWKFGPKWTFAIGGAGAVLSILASLRVPRAGTQRV